MLDPGIVKDTRGNTGYGDVVWHVVDDDRTSANVCAIPDYDVTDDFGSRPQECTVTDFRAEKTPLLYPDRHPRADYAPPADGGCPVDDYVAVREVHAGLNQHAIPDANAEKQYAN